MRNRGAFLEFINAFYVFHLDPSDDNKLKLRQARLEAQKEGYRKHELDNACETIKKLVLSTRK